MECVICRKKEMSKTRCTNGHYICSDCHTSGMDSIVKSCLAESSRDPVRIHRKDDVHGFLSFSRPGASCDGRSRPFDSLQKRRRGYRHCEAPFRQCTAAENKCPAVPADFRGACGAGISAGIYMSIITRATPLAQEAWGPSNRMTARALERIGSVRPAPLLQERFISCNP